MPTKDDRWRAEDIKRQEDPSEEKGLERDRNQHAVMEKSEEEELEEEGRASAGGGKRPRE